MSLSLGALIHGRWHWWWIEEWAWACVPSSPTYTYYTLLATRPPLTTTYIQSPHHLQASVNKEYGEWLRGPVLSYYLLEALTPELAAPLLAQGNVSMRVPLCICSHTYMYIYVYIYAHTYIYIYIRVCVPLCVFLMRVWEGWPSID